MILILLQILQPLTMGIRVDSAKSTIYTVWYDRSKNNKLTIS